MPINTTHWSKYVKHLIETKHPIAQTIIDDFNHIAQTHPYQPSKQPILKWRYQINQDMTRQIKTDLMQWQHPLNPTQQIKWYDLTGILTPDNQKLPYVKLAHAFEDLIDDHNLNTFQLNFNEYAYYYQHHNIKNYRYGTIFLHHQKSVEKVFHQFQIIETDLIKNVVRNLLFLNRR